MNLNILISADGDWLDSSNNFTKWGLVGRFPYTFGIFLAYENALDIRAHYGLIERREKIAAADPFCKGYILWPESSHTDTFLLRYFTANAWRPGNCVRNLPTSSSTPWEWRRGTVWTSHG